MNRILKFTLLFLASCAGVLGQVVPAGTSGGANISYSMRYSQSAQFGSSMGDWQMISPSGSVDYENGSAIRPTALSYTAGYMQTLNDNSTYAASTGFFQRLSLSHGYTGKKWDFGLGDDVSYRPQSPITGFSGVPGIGEPIGGIGSAPPPGESIVMLNTHALNNNSHVQMQRILNYATSFVAGLSYQLLLFPDGNAFDTRTLETNGGINFRLDARNSITTQYVYSRFSYPDYDFHLRTDSAMFGFERSWTRSFKSSASVGPEWIQSAESGNSAGKTIPSSTAISAQADLTYQTHFGSAGANYRRGTTGGSGYMISGRIDDVSASISKSFNRSVTLDLVGGYRHTSSLDGVTNVSGEFGGVQGSWRIGRHLSAFAGYTATSQSSNTAVRPNVLNDLLQIVSFGITFSGETKHAR